MKKAKLIHIDENLLKTIEQEAVDNGRSSTKEIEIRLKQSIKNDSK